MRRTILCQSAVLLIALCIYRVAFPTLDDFVHAIDHGDVIFGDFVFHYYPTAFEVPRSAAPAGGFFYPASFAIFIAPLGALPMETARVVWALLLGVAALCLALVVPHGLFDTRRDIVLATALVLLSPSLAHNAKWGQVSVLITLFALMGVVLYRRALAWRSALCFALAIAIKGYPALFLAPFVAKRDVRFLGKVAAWCTLFCVVLPGMVMGPRRALDFQRVSTNSVLGAAKGVLWDFNSQYFPAVVSRLVSEPAYMSDAYWDHMRWVSLGFAALFGISVLYIEMRPAKEPSIDPAARPLLGVLLAATALPFVIQTSWSHYFLHLPFAQVFLARLLESRSTALAWVLRGTAVVTNLVTVLAIGWLPYTLHGTLFFVTGITGVAAIYVVFCGKNAEAEAPT
jgi:hypothetical protein